MKTAVASWHYGHRNFLENIKFFAEAGFDAISLSGDQLIDSLKNEEEALTRLLKEINLPITVHWRLPESHRNEHIQIFKDALSLFRNFQDKTGLINILSFDVYEQIRDNMKGYLDFALENMNCKIAVEDFGLNQKELEQIEHLKGNPQFGYLIDFGHMYIRLRGLNRQGVTLFTASDLECEANETPTLEHFVKALKSKTFPIFETHMSNNDGISDQHRFLNDGTLDLKMLANALKEIGFDGIFTIESAPNLFFTCSAQEADRGILNDLKIWKKAVD